MYKRLGCDVAWVTAPKEAICYSEGYFRNNRGDWWDESSESWKEGGYSQEELTQAIDFEHRPDEFKDNEYYRLQNEAYDKLLEDTIRVHTPLKTSIQFLDEVKRVQSERAAEYEQDGGERSFAKVATVFNTYRGTNLVPSDVALMLEILKNVRFYSQDGYHSDSVVDKISYGSLWAELVTEERG